MAAPAQKPLLRRQSSLETTTDKAAAAFVRRVLVSPHLSTTTASHPTDSQPADAPAIDASLPPLTSINEIDIQLYALIAILVKDYIYSWYSKFSGNPDFVDDLLQVIAHCTRALEERLRRVDLEWLLLDEIPAIFEAHVQTFRQSRQFAATHVSPADMRIFYSTCRPHPALLPVPNSDASTAEQACNDSLYRQLLADGMLALLLPYDDLRNPCLRSMVGEVLGDMILGGFISGKLCDSIFIYDMIARVALSAGSKRKPWAVEPQPRDQQADRVDRLIRLGLLSPPEAIEKEHSTSKHEANEFVAIALQYCLMFWNILQMLFSIVTSLSALPQREPSTSNHDPDVQQQHTADISATPKAIPTTSSISDGTIHRPIIAYHFWSAAGGLLDLQTRMPWLVGTVALLQHVLLTGPGKLGSTNSHLDSILSHYIIAPVFPLSKHLPTILSALRISLFPNNTSLPQPTTTSTKPPAPPTTGTETTLKTKEQASRAAALALLNLIPESIAKLYFAPQTSPTSTSEKEKERELETMIQSLHTSILAPLADDPYLTRHFIYAVLDRVVAEVFPELKGGSVGGVVEGRC